MEYSQLLSEMENIGKEYGNSLYSTLEENEKDLISIGMFPLNRVQEAEEFAENSILKALSAKQGNMVAIELKENSKKLIRAFSHGFCCGLMEKASSLGKMIC